MKIGSTYQPHKVEVRHLEALAHEVRADGEWFVHSMRELADAAGDAFVDAAAESGSDDCRAMLRPILDWIGACQRALN